MHWTICQLKFVIISKIIISYGWKLLFLPCCWQMKKLQVGGFSGRAEGIRTGGTGNMTHVCRTIYRCYRQQNRVWIDLSAVASSNRKLLLTGLVDGNHVYLRCKHPLDQGKHAVTIALRLLFFKKKSYKCLKYAKKIIKLHRCLRIVQRMIHHEMMLVGMPSQSPHRWFWLWFWLGHWHLLSASFHSPKTCTSGGDLPLCERTSLTGFMQRLMEEGSTAEQPCQHQ